MALNRKKEIHLYLVLISGLVLFVGVGYAILTSNLNIFGTTTINKVSWDIHFDNLRVTDGSVTATNPAEIDANKTTVNFGVSLNTPGDFYEFSVDEVNKGTIDAMVSSIVKTGVTEEQAKYLDYTVMYSSGAIVSEKQLLAADKKEGIKVRVEFKKDITASDLPTTEIILNLSFSINYVQADSSAVSVEHDYIKLPEGYKKISYLYNKDNYAYINPNYINITSVDVSIELDAAVDNIERNKGTYIGANVHFQIVIDSNNRFRMSGSVVLQNEFINDGKRHLFKQNAYNWNSSLYIDDILISTKNWNGAYSSYASTYLLFAMATDNKTNTPYNRKVMYMKLYSCKIYENGNLIRYYLPALDLNNIPCLYDVVNDKTYYNAGTGEFLYSNEISENLK